MSQLEPPKKKNPTLSHFGPLSTLRDADVLADLVLSESEKFIMERFWGRRVCFQREFREMFQLFPSVPVQISNWGQSHIFDGSSLTQDDLDIYGSDLYLGKKP